MSNKSKEATIRDLRREVGFGCPICGSPFLTWHHFDPPWHIEKHWRPEGMIALCREHHDLADGGMYSKDELRRLKKCPTEKVNRLFPEWREKGRLLVRVGGCYTDISAPIVSINGISQLTLGNDERGDLTLSFELRNKNDEMVVKMDENWFTAYPCNVYDMTVTPSSHAVKVWLDKADIGLEFAFRRVTMMKLDEILEQDRERSEQRSIQFVKEMAESLSLGARTFIQDEQRFAVSVSHESSGNPRRLPYGMESWPIHIQEAFLAEDKTAYMVKRWIRENDVLDDEGKIPLISIEQMAIYFHGQRITIKGGIADSLLSVSYSSFFNIGRASLDLSCRCVACLQRVGAWMPFKVVKRKNNR